MFWTIAFDVVVVALLLYRQRRIRGVPRTLRLRMPIFLGVIGLIEVLAYTGGHHVSTSGLWLVLGFTVVGAGVLGFVRALTVQIWESNHWIVRQATGLTMMLWVLSLVLHLATGIGAGQGTANLETASFLLYVALTLGAQAYVVHVRAAPLWRALGPEAGRPLQFTFGNGQAGAGTFFTGFAGFGGDGGSFGNSPQHDPTIIDAEVVEDEDPTELR
jgi:hypothetical protein